MNKIRILLMLLLLLTGFVLSGQQNKATIVFEETEYNFGTFRESDGVVTHTFAFRNDGDLPLIINSVASSCGCTTPEWPEDPVLPGSSGTIRVVYNPKDRPGAFTRSVIVSSNAETPVKNLVIKGVVIPVDLVSEVYQYQIEDLRLETIYASFGEIYNGDTASELIKIYNSSTSKNLKIDFPMLPDHIRIVTEPEVLMPLQGGIMKVEYHTLALNDWDFVVDRIELLINGNAVPGGRVNITANIREDFSSLSADDLAWAPLVSFNRTSHDFGNISPSRLVTYDFLVTNLGKSDLYIRKISASCGCTVIQPGSEVIEPGYSTSIKAVFDPKGQGTGPQKKAITVITNDPKRSKTILWIQAFIQEK